MTFHIFLALLLSHTLRYLQLSQLPTYSSRLFDSNTTAENGRKHIHSRIKISIHAIFQFTHLFMDLNISYYMHTHIQSAGRHILLWYLLFISHVYIHTHIYMSTTLPLFPPVLTANTRTHRYFEQHSLPFLWHIGTIHTHTYINIYITNIFKHCYFLLTFPRLFYAIKIFVFTFLWIFFCLHCLYHLCC